MSLTVDALAIAPQAWKNGGGLTRELLCWPATGDWQVRVSLADIARDGPFSAFPGVQRHFAVLSGAGVALQLNGRWVEQRPGDAPLAFDGAAAPDCRLIDGPTRDLNLMLRGGPNLPLSGGMALAPDPRWTWRAVFDPQTLRLHAGLEAWPAAQPGWLYLGAFSAA